MPLFPAQLLTLDAALARIIPTDDTPGAREAGTIHYITGQLNGDLRFKLPDYQAGLDAVDAESLARHSLLFYELPAQLQDELLTQIEQGATLTTWPVAASAWFRMLVNHAAEGFYGDPENGGNLDAVSWEMIGF